MTSYTRRVYLFHRMAYDMKHIKCFATTVCYNHTEAFAVIMPNHKTVVFDRIKDESKIKFCGTVYKCSFPKKVFIQRKMTLRISFCLFDVGF